MFTRVNTDLISTIQKFQAFTGLKFRIIMRIDSFLIVFAGTTFREIDQYFLAKINEGINLKTSCICSRYRAVGLVKRRKIFHYSLPIFPEYLKGYLRYKTIFCHKVAFDV